MNGVTVRTVLPQARNFSNFIEAYVTYTRGQESSEKIHRWVALSIIAAALERKVWMDRGYYTLFPNLYTFIIGASGIVKKSTSTGIGVDLLRSLENFNMMSERMTAASLILQLSRAGSKYEVPNRPERQQSAVFAYASELSVFLGEVYGSTSELLTTFYDCSPHDCAKPWVYENKSEGKIRIFGPCLNILGASTPTWLTRCIPASEMEGGFSSRVIFVVERDAPKRFVAWPEVKRDVQALKPKLVEDLARIHALSGEFEVAASAREFFTQWYEEHMLKQSKNADGRFSGYFGRKPDTVLKLAMIVRAAESDELIVERRHIDEALMLLDSVEESMFQAFGSAGKNRYAEETFKLWEAVRTAGTITHAALLKLHWRDTSHEEMITIIESLRRMGAISVEQRGPEIVYKIADTKLRL